MTNNMFSSLNINNSLQKALARINLKNMTPIQSQTIPLTLKNKDIIGSAQTGTGKTIAFLIPVLEKALTKDSAGLILVPTRELAAQIHSVITNIILEIQSIKSVLLVGGASITQQIRKLYKKPNIIVGTPGRINDLINKKILNLKTVKTLVIDESDRMLEMGFDVQIDKIIKTLPEERQTLMFSATLSPKITYLAKKYLQDYQNITITSPNIITPKIKQDIKYTDHLKKYGDLLRELSVREGSIIIFVNTKISANNLSKKLAQKHSDIATLHGEIPHRKREKVIKNFRAQNSRIMVATDIASRGLDIDHVKHVINYDLPMSYQDYIHRIGRTGRNESSGLVLNLLLPKDKYKWKSIQYAITSDKKSYQKKSTISSSSIHKNNKNANFTGFYKKNYNT